jgi:uncharacterized protein
MKYKIYGKTGKQVSILGFGGMRFENPEDLDTGAETVLHAYNQGISYFDTAPGYCNDKSEDIMGLAIKEMKKQDHPFYISTKSSKPDGDELREQLETSLKRLNVDKINFFHCWYLSSIPVWEERKLKGAVAAIIKAKEEGLIEHISFSTHMQGSDIRTVIEEGLFEGVTLGYSAINFPYRQEGIQAAAKQNMGVVVMNPLGGGVIPANEESFDFLKIRPQQTLLDGALKFLYSHDEITVSLVGFRNKDDVDTAIKTVEGDFYQREETDTIKDKITAEFDNLCTSCMYCKECPEGIPVWKFVETANGFYLNGTQKMSDRLKYHWGGSIDELDKCSECRECEDICTQKLNILERFESLKERIAEETQAADES